MYNIIIRFSNCFEVIFIYFRPYCAYVHETVLLTRGGICLAHGTEIPGPIGSNRSIRTTVQPE